MKKYAVILAGGEGRRAGGNVPKQFQDLCGFPMVWWAMQAFAVDGDVEIIAVVHPGFFDDWRLMWDEMPEEKRVAHKLCCGGRSRVESVMNALKMIPDCDDALIAVHDAARPMVSRQMIKRGWEAAELSGAVVPAVALSDSIRRLTSEGSKAVDRAEYRAVQTPQVFYAQIIKTAYDRVSDPINSHFTDDASVVENAGFDICIYPGEHTNMKVTNPADFKIAEILLKEVHNF